MIIHSADCQGTITLLVSNDLEMMIPSLTRPMNTTWEKGSEHLEDKQSELKKKGKIKLT